MTYTKEQIAAALDLAVLKPTATQQDVAIAYCLARRHRIASVCVAPVRVSLFADYYRTSAVIGFPYGNARPEVKRFEARKAIHDGAMELDVVVNYGLFRDGMSQMVREELALIVPHAHKKRVFVKAIIEASALSREQIVSLSALCAEYGVDFVKTSTGVNGNATAWEVGAILDAVKGTKTQVKASGGIADYGQAAMFLTMGCTRIGSSKCKELFP